MEEVVVRDIQPQLVGFLGPVQVMTKTAIMLTVVRLKLLVRRKTNICSSLSLRRAGVATIEEVMLQHGSKIHLIGTHHNT